MNIERICDVDHHTHFNLDMEYFSDTCERECILQLVKTVYYCGYSYLQCYFFYRGRLMFIQITSEKSHKIEI